MSVSRAALSRTSVALLSLSVSLGLVACGGSSNKGGGQSGLVGQENPKPGGSGLFIVDPNKSGSGSRLHLSEVRWGRLVDVHEIDAQGDTVPEPVYTDLVIEPTVRTNGTDYLLERDRLSGRDRLVILARKNGMGVDPAAFDALLRAAIDLLPLVADKNDDGTSAPLFTIVPRNASLSMRFDDCLDDSTVVRSQLPDLVRVLTGYPPTSNFQARVAFDPNFGAVVNRQFRPTRILVDFTVSQAEADAYPTAIQVNDAGAPASRPANLDPNLSVRIPSRIDNGSAQFRVLTNLSGIALSSTDNGPADLGSPTVEIVRAMQTGNPFQANNGNLPDDTPPSIVGSWPFSIGAASPDLGGLAQFDFLLDVSFSTVCQADLQAGDLIRIGSNLLEVTQAVSLSGNSATDVPVRSFTSVSSTLALIGSGTFERNLDTTLGVPDACWVTFIPPPLVFPATGVSPGASVVVRFNEPMDPASLSPLDQFLLVKGAASSPASTGNVVVGEVLAERGLTEFTFTPQFSIEHVSGVPEAVHVELDGPTDLAGLALPRRLPLVQFTLDPLEADARNDAIVLRFGSFDEFGQGPNPNSAADLRGQFFPDYARGVLEPRPPSHGAYPADPISSPAVLGFMGTPTTGVPALLGVFPPLVRLGSRLQTVWRYCDFGWVATDETKFNLDVVGLSYRPPGGQVDSDFFERFEIVLGHSRFLPDELLFLNPAGQLLPMYPSSGLPGVGARFADNHLIDLSGNGTPKIVHSRTLGYRIEPRDRFLSSSGSLLMPFPLNRGGGSDITYTWRDTSMVSLAGDGDFTAPGVPLAIENGFSGSAPLAAAGQVPSIYLPLLLEFRCFQAGAVGLNKFDVGMPTTASASPFFRVYSAGGVDTINRDVVVDPDRADIPLGGFNPLSTPAGRTTSTVGDNHFYYGQLDTVTRVSRVHSAWMDVGASITATWLTPIIDPPNSLQPSGTSISLAFRAATAFNGPGGQLEFQAGVLDVYGNLPSGGRAPVFVNNGLWSSSIGSINGSRYMQVRITFVNNIETGLIPTLSALAFPFQF